MTLPTLGDKVPRRQSGFSSWLGTKVMNMMGWRIVGDFPNQEKFIIAVAPHTSNWDFVVAFATMLAMRLDIKFLGKASIFIWPFKKLLTHFGGVPVERSKTNGVVGQTVAQFEQNKSFVLALAPEGTRSKTVQWKTGFLQMAQQANVPVVPVSLHFDVKELRVHKATAIEGDISQELERIKSYFKNACAKNPQAV